MFPAYHAHVYFDENTVEQADQLCEEAESLFKLKRGRMHHKPVGPHPFWSCQLAFAASEFATLIPWLVAKRNGLSVLVHPVSGDDLKDHSEHAMWLGNSAELDLSIFKN